MWLAEQCILQKSLLENAQLDSKGDHHINAGFRAEAGLIKETLQKVLSGFAPTNYTAKIFQWNS
jgi:hypothetical protein